MINNFIQFNNQSNLENFLESTGVEELDDVALLAVNGGVVLLLVVLGLTLFPPVPEILHLLNKGYMGSV